VKIRKHSAKISLLERSFLVLLVRLITVPESTYISLSSNLDDLVESLLGCLRWDLRILPCLHGVGGSARLRMASACNLVYGEHESEGFPGS
jgi:hypothetical protein